MSFYLFVSHLNHSLTSVSLLLAKPKQLMSLAFVYRNDAWLHSDPVIPLLYPCSAYLRLTVQCFKFHTPLQISSQRSHYVPFADADPRRLLCFHPLDQPFPNLLPRPWFVNDFLAVCLTVGADCGWLSRISIWCQRHLTCTCVHACPPPLRKYPVKSHTGMILKSGFILESDKDVARPLQKKVGLVWNIDVLWDLRGAAHEIYKLLLPVAMFTFCCGAPFLFH